MLARLQLGTADSLEAPKGSNWIEAAVLRRFLCWT